MIVNHASTSVLKRILLIDPVTGDVLNQDLVVPGNNLICLYAKDGMTEPDEIVLAPGAQGTWTSGTLTAFGDHEIVRLWEFGVPNDWLNHNGYSTTALFFWDEFSNGADLKLVAAVEFILLRMNIQTSVDLDEEDLV